MSDGGSLLQLSDAASSTPIHKMMGGGEVDGGSLLHLSDSASRVPIDPQRGGVGVAFIKQTEESRKKSEPTIGTFINKSIDILKKYGLSEGGIIANKLSQSVKDKFIEEINSGKCLKGTGDNIISSSECEATVKVIRELINYHIDQTNKTHLKIKKQKSENETILDIDITIVHDKPQEKEQGPPAPASTAPASTAPASTNLVVYSASPTDQTPSKNLVVRSTSSKGGQLRRIKRTKKAKKARSRKTNRRT